METSTSKGQEQIKLMNRGTVLKAQDKHRCSTVFMKNKQCTLSYFKERNTNAPRYHFSPCSGALEHTQCRQYRCQIYHPGHSCSSNGQLMAVSSRNTHRAKEH